jgi:hypothetical protein
MLPTGTFHPGNRGQPEIDTPFLSAAATAAGGGWLTGFKIGIYFPRIYIFLG